MANSSLTSGEFQVEKSFRIRLYSFTGLVLFTLIAFLFQLINLQIINGEENLLKAEKFIRKSEIIIATRGQFFDRNFITPEVSEPLVYNSSALDVFVNTSLFNYKPLEVKKFIYEFSRTLSIPLSYYQKSLKEPEFSKLIKSKKSFILLKNISQAQHERISYFDTIHQYVTFVPSPKRIYQIGPALAHVGGYLGKPSRTDLLEKDVKTYQVIGKAGLELLYDSELKGVDGYRIQKRNADGNIEEERIMEYSIPGNNLILTIDKKVQLAAYRALENKRGTAIAIKPSTGEVIALVSNPSYNPNILSDSNNRLERSNHFKEVKDSKGFLNLAIQSKFPPASTFKPIVALAGLETSAEPEVLANTEYMCDGRYILKSSFSSVPDQTILCWEEKGHGRNNLIQAIKKSCSVYFYQLGLSIGPEKILTYSNLLGLNLETGIDLPGEITGFIPSSSWKKANYGSRWFDGDTINLSIGQGFISATPIEMALAYMALINNGKIFKPFIVKEIRDQSDNSLIKKMEPTLLREIPINKTNLDIIKTGLRLVVTEGTARGILNTSNLPQIAGKTGTAQTRKGNVSRSNHAWFIGYAPFDQPVNEQLLVVVFMEYGVGGAVGAAPVAREIFSTSFPKKRSQ